MIDLHTHSTFSDGSFTPEEIVSAAKNIGLSAVALCDHNSGDGLSRFIKAAENQGITAIPGCELTSSYLGKELHIIGLFIKSEHFDYIRTLMSDYHRQKAISNNQLIENLNKNGYKISFSNIKEKTKGNFVNRAHFAVVLTEKGYTKSVNEAFKTLLSRRTGFYKPTSPPSALDLIKELKKIDAVTVLAHPILSLNRQELTEFLPKARQAGLDAIEAYYTTFSDEETKFLITEANKNSLLLSGGSDFHGTMKSGISLGTGFGNLNIDDNILEKLKEKIYE